MEQMEQILRANVPARVSAAINFVTAMRSTAGGQLGLDAGKTACQANDELAAYHAALELARRYFDGEMYPDCARPDPGDGASGDRAPNVPPSPSASPAPARIEPQATS